MDIKARAFVIISSKHSHINKGMIGQGKYNHKLKGYEITIENLPDTNPVSNNPPRTQTLFFERHECKRMRTSN